MAALAALAVLGIYLHRPFRYRMSAYVTDLSGRSPAQRENIRRAGLAFSGRVIRSGETFSLNEAAGPYTAERGFLPERTYLGDRLVQSPGGGVCQVASTLFNAAREAGLEIVERVPHTGPVLSVPQGEDATLVYGYADLKLRNPNPYPIQLVSKVVNGQLRIEIWGKERHDDAREL